MWSLLLRHFWDQGDDALVGEWQNPVVAKVQQRALELGIASTEPGVSNSDSVAQAAEEVLTNDTGWGYSDSVAQAVEEVLNKIIKRHQRPMSAYEAYRHEVNIQKVSMAARPVTPDGAA